jgi:hypothetical protein
LPLPRVVSFSFATPWALFVARGLGAVVRCGHRGHSSDSPSRATEQAQTGVRSLAVPLPRMRSSVGASVSTLRSGRSGPARFGDMAPTARTPDFTTTLPFAKHLRAPDALARILAPSAEPPRYGRGAFNQPVPRVANLSGARGPRARRSPWGVGSPAAAKRRRGMTRDPTVIAAARSLAEERAAAGRGGGQGRTASHPRRRQNQRRYEVA